MPPPPPAPNSPSYAASIPITFSRHFLPICCAEGFARGFPNGKQGLSTAWGGGCGLALAMPWVAAVKGTLGLENKEVAECAFFLGLLYLGMGRTYGENFWALGQLGPPKNAGSIFSPIISNI